MKYGTLHERRVRNASMLAEYESTPVTQSIMAERYGVHINTIRNWLNSARKERARQRRRRALVADAQGLRKPRQSCRRCWVEGHNVLTCTEPKDRYYNV